MPAATRWRGSRRDAGRRDQSSPDRDSLAHDDVGEAIGKVLGAGRRGALALTRICQPHDYVETRAPAVGCPEPHCYGRAELISQAPEDVGHHQRHRVEDHVGLATSLRSVLARLAALGTEGSRLAAYSPCGIERWLRGSRGSTRLG